MVEFEEFNEFLGVFLGYVQWITAVAHVLHPKGI